MAKNVIDAMKSILRRNQKWNPEIERRDQKERHLERNLNV